MSKYKQEYCDKVIAHMSKGQSFESFGGVVGVCHKTLYNWLEAHDEFCIAKSQGELKGLNYWEQVGIAGMVGKIKGFNPVMWIFVLKCRYRKFGYRDYEPEEDPRKIEDKTAQVARLMQHLTEMVKDTQCQPVQVASIEAPQGLLNAAPESK